MEMAVAKSPGEKVDETFNLFWMGFQYVLILISKSWYIYLIYKSMAVSWLLICRMVAISWPYGGHT